MVDVLLPRPTPAVITERETVSYDALIERVARRKQFLQSRGISRGVRVLVACNHSLATVENLLALFEMEALQIPNAWQTPQQETETLAATAFAAYLVRDDEVYQFRDPHAPPSTNESRQFPEPPVLGLLSSGSTGTPKLVLRSRFQILAGARIYTQSVGLTSADRILAVLPLEHSYGFHNVVLATMLSGATMILPSMVHPRVALELIHSHNVTVLPAAPIFFDLLVRFAPEGISNFPLRAGISVGTALATRIWQRFTEHFACPLWQSYGTSESGPVALNRNGTPDGERLALGQLCPGVMVSLNPLPDDERASSILVGEILVQSPAVALGYDSSVEGGGRFEGDRFYTGDLGELRDGVLYFRGRIKTLIAAAGHKVDPAEIEQVLLQHPNVGDVAVVGEPDPDGVEQIKAYVVARPPVPAVELIEFCSARLAPFKVPRKIEFRDSLPRNAMGKLQKAQLQ